MNISRKLSPFVFLCLSLSACMKDENPIRVSADEQGLCRVEFTAALEQEIGTKTSYDAVNHLGLWKREDMAGVIAGYGAGSYTDTRMQPFSLENRNSAGGEFLLSTTFTGKLTNKGSQTYTYYAVYPYTAFQDVTDASNVSSRLEERQYPDLKSWDGACDMLASKPLTVTSSSVAASNLQVQFTRLFGMLRLRFDTSITDLYGTEVVETISIESTNVADKLAGKFTIDLTSTEAPDPVMSSTTGEYFNKVTLDYRGKNATLSNVDAYFVLNPGTYSNVTITIKTKDHTLTLPRTGLTVNRSCVASAALSWKSGTDAQVASMSLLPKNPSSLKILTFGHSFVDDSMEYVDDLLNAAGVTNVTFAHFYIANCSLQTYCTYLNTSNTIQYNKRYYNGATVTTSQTNKTVLQGLCDEPWDVIVFQTNVEKLGYYDYFASSLQTMIDYVKTTCQIEHGKTPTLAWHMFWAHGSRSYFLSDNYSGDQELNYAAHVQASKEIMRNKDIQLIIPTGTAVQSLRRSSLNNSYSGGDAFEFCRDGKSWSHMDYMAGRYVAACTWFEFFLKPCFGTSVLGNTYMPPTGSAGVSVTAENREFIQRAAVLACQSPFEIAHLDDIPEPDVNVSGSTEEFSPSGSYDSGNTESFSPVNDLTW